MVFMSTLCVEFFLNLFVFRWLLATGRYEECTNSLQNILAFNKEGK